MSSTTITFKSAPVVKANDRVVVAKKPTVTFTLPEPRFYGRHRLSIIDEKAHRDLDGKDFELPSFTMKQVYDAIPPHCFRPNNFRSFGYVLRDLFLTSCLIYAATHIPSIPYMSLRGLAWATYAIAQGMVWTGLWILGHECGHGALFTSRRLNSTIGWLLHSFLLVPYFSWRLSHRKHHKSTGHLDKDMVFSPETKDEFLNRKFGQDTELEDLSFDHLAEDTPLYNLYKLVEHQLFGMPLYLLFSLSAPYKGYDWWKVSHFYWGEGSPIFSSKDARDVAISDVGIAATLSCVYAAVQYFGAWNTFIYYIVPYLFVNHWIVAITYLQHTDGSLPHYRDGAWTFARGATATIDRDFGFIGRHLFHGIIETHVLHHLVSSIPFYRAEEATQAIKGILGEAYQSDTETNILVALWRNLKRCQWIEESYEGSGVYFFRNLKGEQDRRTGKKKN